MRTKDERKKTRLKILSNYVKYKTHLAPKNKMKGAIVSIATWYAKTKINFCTDIISL